MKLSDILLDDDHEAVLADKQHWEAQTHEATSECYKLVGIIWFDLVRPRLLFRTVLKRSRGRTRSISPCRPCKRCQKAN